MLAMNPQGTRLVFVAAESIVILDAQTGDELRKIASPAGVRCLAISRQGVLAAGLHRGGVALFSVETGETTAQLKLLKAPFIYGMAVLCLLTGLIHLVLMVKPPPDLAEGEGAAL